MLAAVIIVLLLILLAVVPFITIFIYKRINLSKPTDGDVAHCNVNPSYDTVHSTTTNKHNIVYDEVHITPSCTDNPAYGTQ